MSSLLRSWRKMIIERRLNIAVSYLRRAREAVDGMEGLEATAVRAGVREAMRLVQTAALESWRRSKEPS